MCNLNVPCTIYALITRQLKYAREGVSHGGLGLLTKHRKRERLRTLLDLLKTLKTLVGEIVFCQSSLFAEDIGRWLWYIHISVSLLFCRHTFLPLVAKNRRKVEGVT